MGHAVTIDRRFDELSEKLVGAPRDLFPRSIGIHVVGIPVRKRIVVEFGEGVKTTTWAVVDVTWKATFPEKLFPTMEGKVSLSRAGQNASKLAVSGIYEPPLGRVGEDLNAAVMHGVAERTVKELAETIARRLRQAA